MITKSAMPIVDGEIKSVLKKISLENLFTENSISPLPDIKKKFKNTFINWLEADLKLKKIFQTWDSFLTEGTTSSFIDFRHIHQGKIYTLIGEYPFHRMTGSTVVKHYSEIPDNKALIISYPFSATGNVHCDFFDLLKYCNKNNIAVLVDCALLPISSNDFFDVNQYESIAAVSFSLSKSFSSGRFRSGICFTKNKWLDSSGYILNEWSYLNHLSMHINLQLLEKFPYSYIFNKYMLLQKKICLEYSLTPSSSVIFGLSSNSTYEEYSRSGVINRICISRLLGKLERENL